MIKDGFDRCKICILMKVCGPSQKASAMKGMEMFLLGGKAVATRMFLATGSLIFFTIPTLI